MHAVVGYPDTITWLGVVSLPLGFEYRCIEPHSPGFPGRVHNDYGRAGTEISLYFAETADAANELIACFGPPVGRIEPEPFC